MEQEKKNMDSLEEFLMKEEALKLKDQLPEHQKKLLAKRIDKKYFEMDVPAKSENLIGGEWNLSKEEKDEAMQMMFMFDAKKIDKLLEDWKPSEKFVDICKVAKTGEIDINFVKPSLLDLKVMTGNIFHLISVGETRADRIIVKGEDGKPVMDENKRPVYKEKVAGDVVLSTNKSNFNAFYDSYVLAFPEEKLAKNPFTSPAFTNVLSMVVNRNFDVDLFSKFDLQLYISSKPEDFLNMSLSKFYDSCQNLYGGSHNRHLPANLFDSNVKIAYLRFNTPFVDVKKNIVPFTIFSRCLIRNIKGQIYFDVVYPNQLSNFFRRIITKYTGMENNYKGRNYFYTNIGLGRPYMDTLTATGLRHNANAYKDSRLQALAKELKLVPEDIFDVEKNLYVTDKGTYKIMTAEEADEATRNFLVNEMVYKQDVYKPFVNIQAFYDANIEVEVPEAEKVVVPKAVKAKGRKLHAEQLLKPKKEEKLLKWYKGEANFEQIAAWAEEQPMKKVKKKDGTIERVPSPDKKNRISKHNLYRAMKPFMDPVFFDEKTTPAQIAKKRIKLATDDIQLVLGDDLFAYKQPDKHLPGDDYPRDGMFDGGGGDDDDDFDEDFDDED